jgi:hypothetical protein
MDGKDVYDLYTKYNSMHEIVKQDKFGATDEGFFQPKEKEEKEGPSKQGSETVPNSRHNDKDLKPVYDYSQGIPLDIFMENCNVFKGKHEDVINAILKALGIQHSVAGTTVSIEEFLKMSTIMTHFTAT